jgi:cell division protease FtsH
VRQSHKTLILWGVLVLMFYVLYSYVAHERQGVEEVHFSVFLDALESGQLLESPVEIKNESEFTWHEMGEKGQVKKRATGKLTDDTLKELREHKVAFKMIHEDNTTLWHLLLSWAPMLLVFVFLFFLMRQLQAGGGKALSFGKSKARLVSDNTSVTFKDVAGADEAKEELYEIIEFLKEPKKFTRLGGRIPKGVLLMGSPGTGKTLLARAIAGEAGVPFFSISGSDFVEMFVGVGASRVRDLFEQSKKHAPCIIFVDEIDAVGRHRGAGLGGGHDEREQTLNQLLVEMDGFESNEGVILIAATNRPDVLDPALLRPGRFDRRVVVPMPDMLGRYDILKVHTKKVPLAENVDLDIMARGTPGFAGADIANLVNEAALVAARRDQHKVNHLDFEHARDKVLMGAERKSMVMSEKELRNTAYHEAGHTLIAAKVQHADPVHKVTIVPRGRALGLTQMLPETDRLSMTKRYALDQICIMFGGRIAEVLTFDELTTGAGNDLEKATEIARKMICQWGMSHVLGPMTFGTRDESVFLGREITRHQEYSEKTADLIDDDVRAILDSQYQRAQEIIENNLDQLKILAEALLEHETLELDDIRTLLAGETLDKEPPRVKMTTREDMDRRRQAREQHTSNDSNSDTISPVLGPLVQSKA